MFLIYFLLWVIFNGRFTLEIGLFGLAIAGALLAFSCKFADYSLESIQKYLPVSEILPSAGHGNRQGQSECNPHDIDPEGRDRACPGEFSHGVEIPGGKSHAGQCHHADAGDHHGHAGGFRVYRPLPGRVHGSGHSGQ